MNLAEYAQILDRLDEQDRRIQMLANRALQDSEDIRKALALLQRVLAPKDIT